MSSERWNLFTNAAVREAQRRRCHTGNGTSGPLLSKHNHILYYKHAQSVRKMDSLSLIASQGVTVSSALLWLLTGRHFGENQQRRTLHHLGRQVSSQITFFPLNPSHRGAHLRLQHGSSAARLFPSLPSSNAASLRLERMSQILQIFFFLNHAKKRGFKVPLGSVWPACLF